MDLLDILSAIGHFLWDWPGALKTLMILAGIGLIVAAAMDAMKPVPPIAGFVAGPALLIGSLVWIIYDAKHKQDVYY